MFKEEKGIGEKVLEIIEKILAMTLEERKDFVKKWLQDLCLLDEQGNWTEMGEVVVQNLPLDK